MVFYADKTAGSMKVKHTRGFEELRDPIPFMSNIGVAYRVNCYHGLWSDNEDTENQLIVP